MLIVVERRERLAALAEAARYDLSCACGDTDRQRGELGRWIYPAAMPDGGTQPILKAALTSACERDCTYCALRAGRDCARHVLAPEEMARSFDEMARAGRVRGLFLTSGIRGGAVRTMDRLIDTAEVLRRRHRFRGYLHLKIIPGCERDQVERAVRVATRVSVNLEVPGASHLSRVCPRKHWDRDIMDAVRWAHEAIERPGSGSRSQTTQMVVGAGNETDREIILRAGDLYERFGLSRVYYSAFQPVAGTPLEDRPPAPFLREHRLYQADTLLRKYGFAAGEIPFAAGHRLDEARDPKQAWADLHAEIFPVEINTADRTTLLRVPGLGPSGVDRILARRRAGTLGGPEDLGITGKRARKVARYVLWNGRVAEEMQLALGL